MGCEFLNENKEDGCPPFFFAYLTGTFSVKEEESMRSKLTGDFIIPVPTLSEQGYVYSTGDKLDRLLSYYLLTDANQSEIFKDVVVSYQHLIAQHQHQPNVLCGEVKKQLEQYLSRYFNVATVEVTFKDLKEGTNDGPYEVVIDAIAGDTIDDQQRLYKNVRMEDGILTTVFTYNNTGRLLRNDTINQRSRR